MRCLDLMLQVSISSMSLIGKNDSRSASCSADQLKARIEDRQKELADDEQLEAMAGLLSWKARGVEAIDEEHPALSTVRLWEKDSG